MRYRADCVSDFSTLFTAIFIFSHDMYLFVAFRRKKRKPSNIMADY